MEPCPFCGEEENLRIDRGDDVVYCNEGGCPIYMVEVSIKDWNYRPEEQEIASLQIMRDGIMMLIKEERELLGLEPGQSSLEAIRGLLRGCSEKEQVIEQISEKPVRKKRKSVFSKQERQIIIQELKDLGIKFNERGSTSTMAKKWVEYLEGRLALDLVVAIDVETYKDPRPRRTFPIDFNDPAIYGKREGPKPPSSYDKREVSPYDCSAPRIPDKEPDENLKDESPYDCSGSDEPADIAFLRKNGHI